MEAQTKRPIPLFWFAIAILVVQSLIVYADRAADNADGTNVNAPAWGPTLLVAVGVLVLAVCFLLVWKWKLYLAATLLFFGALGAYLGPIGWLFSAVLVVTGVVLSLAASSPVRKVEIRHVSWASDSEGGAPIGPIAALVGLAVLVIGIEALAAFLSTDGLRFGTTPDATDSEFNSKLVYVCAGLLVVIAGIYAAGFRAWLSGICLLAAAVGAALGYFLLVPTAAFALAAIAVSFVEPKKIDHRTGQEIVVYE
ncbi:MAG: hypothetical protein JW722_02785 [Demequinaceae bacterium]|nr:hypothetical protein [Demequinaceae bacterium]